MENPLIGMSKDGYEFLSPTVTEDGDYLKLEGSVVIGQHTATKNVTFWIPKGTEKVTLVGTPLQGWTLWDQQSHAYMGDIPPMKASFTHLDETQQFRVKLKAYLGQFVVPQLRNGKEVVIKMDGSVHDRLSTGPHLAASWVNIIYYIGEYARAILFYEFNIRTYPIRDMGKLTVTFPVTEPTDAMPVGPWEPIPNVKSF